jgi:hypothetical protein
VNIFISIQSKKLKILYLNQFLYIYSGTSLDNKSTLPSIEPTDNEYEILHSFIRNNFQSLLQSNCPKVFILIIILFFFN